MVYYDHALVGATLAVAAGMQRRYGWPAVMLAALAGMFPDWDATPKHFYPEAYVAGHRVWGHNLFAVTLAGAALGGLGYLIDRSPGGRDARSARGWDVALCEPRLDTCMLREHRMTVGTQPTADGVAIRQLAERVRSLRERTLQEVGRVVVGMEAVTHQFLIDPVSPGLAKRAAGDGASGGPVPPDRVPLLGRHAEPRNPMVNGEKLQGSCRTACPACPPCLWAVSPTK